MTEPTPKPKPKSKTPTVRVLKAGDDKISTGKRENHRDVNFKHKDTFTIDRAIAEKLEARGFVEIED